jgi:hypothetical protein
MIIEIPIGLFVDGDVPDHELEVLGLQVCGGERPACAALRVNWDENGLRIALLCPVFYKRAYELGEVPRVWAPDEDVRRVLPRGRAEGVLLEAAYLPRANLRDLELPAAHAPGASFQEANLAGCNLAFARLSRVDFYKADLSRANLVGTDLVGANLVGADFTGADFTGALLAGAIVGAGTSFDRAVLDRVNWTGALCGSWVPEGWRVRRGRLIPDRWGVAQ